MIATNVYYILRYCIYYVKTPQEPGPGQFQYTNLKYLQLIVVFELRIRLLRTNPLVSPITKIEQDERETREHEAQSPLRPRWGIEGSPP